MLATLAVGEPFVTETLIKVDLSKSPLENDMIHNRWHPDIPMVAKVKPGAQTAAPRGWSAAHVCDNDSDNAT